MKEQILAHAQFLRRATNKYRIHSPFVFELAMAVLEDSREFYAFREIEHLRKSLLRDDTALELRDFGAGPANSRPTSSDSGFSTRRSTVKLVAARAGTRPRQGRMLFRLIQHIKPTNALEIGCSLGIGTMYMASGMPSARFLALDGDPASLEIAQKNVHWLGCPDVEFWLGAFEESLAHALNSLGTVDFVFFDGNHRKEPTLQYFEQCLPFAHENSVFVFDDIFWSNDMLDAWNVIKEHPKVRLTIEFLDFALVFFNPELLEKQHLSLVPARWKPWIF